MIMFRAGWMENMWVVWAGWKIFNVCFCRCLCSRYETRWMHSGFYCFDLMVVGIWDNKYVLCSLGNLVWYCWCSYCFLEPPKTCFMLACGILKVMSVSLEKNIFGVNQFYTCVFNESSSFWCHSTLVIYHQNSDMAISMISKCIYSIPVFHLLILISQFISYLFSKKNAFLSWLLLFF